MGADSNELLRRTKAILQSPDGNRDAMINALMFQKENKVKGAISALKWLLANQKCAHCDEIKSADGFRSTNARAFCKDCRSESKQSFFFSLPIEQAEALTELANARKMKPRDLVIEWVTERLAK